MKVLIQQILSTPVGGRRKRKAIKSLLKIKIDYMGPNAHLGSAFKWFRADGGYTFWERMYTAWEKTFCKF